MSAERPVPTKQPAAELARLCLEATRDMNSFLLDIQANGSPEDLDAAKKMVGRILAEFYVAALYPIYERYPDLKPPGFP